MLAGAPDKGGGSLSGSCSDTVPSPSRVPPPPPPPPSPSRTGEAGRGSSPSSAMSVSSTLRMAAKSAASTVPSSSSSVSRATRSRAAFMRSGDSAAAPLEPVRPAADPPLTTDATVPGTQRGGALSRAGTRTRQPQPSASSHPPRSQPSAGSGDPAGPWPSRAGAARQAPRGSRYTSCHHTASDRPLAASRTRATGPSTASSEAAAHAL